MKYRNLKDGEPIEKGDQYFTFGLRNGKVSKRRRWYVVKNIVVPVYDSNYHVKFRRPFKEQSE